MSGGVYGGGEYDNMLILYTTVVHVVPGWS